MCSRSLEGCSKFVSQVLLPQRSLGSSERLRYGHDLDLVLPCPVLHVFLSLLPPRVHDHVLSMCSLYRSSRWPCWLSCPVRPYCPFRHHPRLISLYNWMASPHASKHSNCPLHYFPQTNVQRNLEEEDGQGDTHLSPWRMPKMPPMPSER
jgi:hypothetical protein